MVKECFDGNYATPMNTIGMGGVEPCNVDPLVSEPSKEIKPKKCKKRKMKSLKSYIQHKI